ncbi:MAG TPA: HEAT repeat domain-containing protein [Candidatus Angelobacter sp.]|jgi:HEAT repeat protein
MNRKLLVILFFLAGAIFSARPTSAAAQEVPSASFVDPQAAEKANAHEDQVYAAAKDALDQEQYAEAIRQFDEVWKGRGRKADAAMYWKAYSLNKAGNRAQALALIAEFKKAYPKSTWIREADIAEQQWRGTANPESISDEELKLLALQSLMNSDPERAVPLLDKVIHGNNSPKLKDKALFVLSQSGSPKAQEILLTLAKANNQPDLQKRAIRYMGMNGNKGNRAVLKEIYNSSPDVSVKKTVFQAWLMSGDKEDVLAVARTEKDPELRKEAIRYLGMLGGRDELRQLYKEATDPDAKENLLQSMGMAGDAEGLNEAAASEKDPGVRKHAIRDIGMFGGDGATKALLTIYNANSDLDTRKEVANALFLHGAGKELVALARKETDPQMKRELIQKMSLMSSPEITEYMMEILNK